MSRREARAKRARIMVELTPADYEVLNRWRASADKDLDQPAGETTLAGGGQCHDPGNCGRPRG
jgi:hypothetical protein